MKKPLSKQVLENIEKWLNPPYDENTRQEVKKLLDSDPHALKDAFHAQVSFGTGGMRALMGLGTNRLNRYTIGTASQGLANYILKKNRNSLSKRQVAILEGDKIKSHEGMMYGRMYAQWKIDCGFDFL